jgi:hypothetical protein
MSAIPTPSSLSASIAGPLRRVAGRKWWLVAGTGLLQLMIVVLTVVLAAVLVLGTFADLPYAARVALGFVAWGAVGMSVVVFLKPALVRRPLSHVAREVESRLGDRRELLSSAVELAGQEDPRYAGSPELVSHLLRQAEEAARGVNPEQLVPLQSLARWSMLLFPVLLCWVVLMPAMPTPMMRGFYALLTPWKAQPPAGLAAVTVMPGDATVAEGDAIEFGAVVAPRLRAKPNVNGALLEMRSAGGQSGSIEMTRTGSRAFKAALEHALASFTYRVTTEDGSSPWHAVKVMPRPAVAAIDVHYEYPAYTKLRPKEVPGSDGSLDALVGTEARLTIHATQALSDASRLVIGEKTPDEQRVELVASGNNTYAAKITIAKSAQYRIAMANTDNLASRDDIVHSITARPDNAPTVTIASPAARILAPPDDTVPIRYTAADDFGLVKLEAIVQIDGQSPETFPILLKTEAGGTKASGRWNLVLPFQLARKNLRDANRVEYQLRVTDNRVPNSQVGLSARQAIEIDHAFKESVAARRDAEEAKSLAEPIRKAIKELDEQKKAIDPLAKVGPDRVFPAAMKKTAATAKDALDRTATELAKAAKENDAGAMADVAETANQIAEDTIRKAAEEAASAVLAQDQPAERQQDLTAAAGEVDTAKKALEGLLEQLNVEAKQEQVARALADTARREREIARDLAKPEKQQDRNQDVQRQQALAQRLDELLNQNKELNGQQDREAAQRNQQLARRIEQLEEQQKRLDGLAEKQQAVADAQRPVNELAERQKELNKAIEALAGKEQQELKDANARTPSDQKLNDIVQALREPNRVPEGNRQQRESADELNRAAQQLANASKSQDGPPGNRARQDKQDVDRAKAAEKIAKDLAKQMEQAKTAKDADQAKDQVKQKEQQLAEGLDQQAGEMQQREPGQKEAIEAAQKGIAEAKEAAEAGDLAKADQQLADAAEKLEAAAVADANAARAEQKEMAAAAQRAGELAQKQQQLADQTAKAAEALGRARQQQGDPNQLQRGEDQAAQQVEQVAGEANQASQQDQGQGERAMADRAQAAEKALKEAAQDARTAAQASKENQPQRAAAAQRAAEQALARAEEAVRGTPDRGEAMAQNDSGKGEAAGTPDANADAKGEQANAREKGEENGDAVGRGGNPANADASAPQGSPSESMKQAATSAQEARQAQQEAMGGRADAAAQAARALNRAARAVQSAARQQEAQIAQSNPALARAERAQSSSAARGQPQQGRGQARAGNEPGRDPGQGQSQAQASSSTPGQSTDSQQGVSVTGIARVDGRPESVKEIGISASDWAKLPPLTQQQLLNAAQQSGPPGYQEAIKNYFVKIAKIQAEDADANAK